MSANEKSQGPSKIKMYNCYKHFMVRLLTTLPVESLWWFFYAWPWNARKTRFRCSKPCKKLSHKHADHVKQMVSEGITVLLYDIAWQHCDCKFPRVAQYIFYTWSQCCRLQKVSICNFNDASTDSGSEDYCHILYVRQSIFGED